MARQNAISSLNLSFKMNRILTNEEAECGAVTSDELGKIYFINNEDIEAEDDDG